MTIDDESGFGGEQSEILAALTAAAKETGFALDDSGADDSGITEPSEVKDAISDPVSEADVRNGKVDLADDQEPTKAADKPADEAPEEAAEAKEGEADDKTDDAGQAADSVDWAGLGLGDDAAALGALPAETSARIAKSMQAFGEMTELVETYKDAYAARGINVTPDNLPTYMKSLARLDDYAARDPAGYAKWFVGATGLNPAELFNVAAPKKEAADPDAFDPWGDEEEEEPAPSKAAQPGQPAADAPPAFDPSRPSQAEIAREQARWAAVFQNYAEAKDDAGELRRPHFSKVVPAIEAGLKQVQAKAQASGETLRPEAIQSVLDTIYSAAVAADPELGPAEAARLAAAKARDAGRAKAKQGEERVRRAARASRTAAAPAPGARSNGVAPSNLPMKELIAGIASGEIT